MKPLRRNELLRPRHAQYLSIVDLIAFVTAFAVWFGCMRVAGVYGFLLGCFALQAASGRLLKRNDLPLGALCGTLSLAGTVIAAWACFGTFADTFPEYSETTREKLKTVAGWIQEYRTAHDAWPNSLAELEPLVASRTHHFGWTFDLQTSFHYERTAAGFELMFLGADDRHGGEGLDADVSLAAADTFAIRRIPVREFLTQTPGSACMMLSLLTCFATGVFASIVIHRDSGQPLYDLLCVTVLAAMASIVGCLFVSVSLIVWRMP